MLSDNEIMKIADENRVSIGYKEYTVTSTCDRNIYKLDEIAFARAIESKVMSDIQLLFPQKNYNEEELQAEIENLKEHDLPDNSSDTALQFSYNMRKTALAARDSIKQSPQYSKTVEANVGNIVYHSERGRLSCNFISWVDINVNLNEPPYKFDLNVLDEAVLNALTTDFGIVFKYTHTGIILSW